MEPLRAYNSIETSWFVIKVTRIAGLVFTIDDQHSISYSLNYHCGVIAYK